MQTLEMFTTNNGSDHANGTTRRRLPTPREVRARQPASSAALRFVAASRQGLADILHRRGHRLIAVVGPCSIHDPEAAVQYARKLKPLADEISDTLLVVMRAYFEKPRTALGWKGLINDPHLNDTFHVEHGLALARGLLLQLAAIGLPVATEALDPLAPQYIEELVSWSAIGARTAESQTHREMASGLGSVVGVKNGTNGALAPAINALRAAARPHRFLGIDADGRVAVVHTAGNPNGHIVLRGGDGGPNYQGPAIARCEAALAAAGLPANIMVDCSHANAHERQDGQLLVADAVAAQVVAGNRSIVGIMLESNIAPGKQALCGAEELAYGVSITDPCLGWEETAAMLRRVAAMLRQPLLRRFASDQLAAVQR